MSQILALLPEARTATRGSVPTPPTAPFAAASLAEKHASSYYQPTPPPPVYAPHSPPVLATATALYAYHPSDAGDLAFATNDRIAVHEFMNADWAKGRNDRTAQEGIFPRSYVQIVDDAGVHAPPPMQMQLQHPQPQQGHGGMGGFGSMPLAVAESGNSSGGLTGNAKIDSNGKKFGKKLGNAAIFGAGATIGSSIVGSIL